MITLRIFFMNRIPFFKKCYINSDMKLNFDKTRLGRVFLYLDDASLRCR